MADQPKQPTLQQIPLNTGDEMSRGRFSNTMFVAHGPEEFMIDWLLNSPNGSHLVSRIIVTPGHMKRIVNALVENLQRFEKQFGEVKLLDLKDQKFN